MLGEFKYLSLFLKLFFLWCGSSHTAHTTDVTTRKAFGKFLMCFDFIRNEKDFWSASSNIEQLEVTTSIWYFRWFYAASNTEWIVNQLILIEFYSTATRFHRLARINCKKFTGTSVWWNILSETPETAIR